MLARSLHLSGQCAILLKVFASVLCSSTKINKIRPFLPPLSNACFSPPHPASLVCMRKISLIIMIVVAVVSSRSEL